MVALISLGMTQKYDELIYQLVSCQGFYLTVLVIWRSYSRAIDNVGLITLYFTTLFVFAIPLALRFLSISETDEIFLVFIIQGMILISLALAFIRVIVYYTKAIKGYLYPQEEQLMIE